MIYILVDICTSFSTEISLTDFSKSIFERKEDFDITELRFFEFACQQPESEKGSDYI